MALAAATALADSMQMNIISRHEWGAMPPKAIDTLTLPVDKVLFSAENEFGHCLTREECAKSVKEVQQHYMNKGLDDMPYSFVIGNDGNVYEGRGWTSKPGPDILKNEDYHDKTIDIGVLVGHDEVVPEKMDLVRAAFRAAEDFVKSAITADYITKDYKFEGFSDDVEPTGYVAGDEIPPPPSPLTDPAKALSSCVLEEEEC